MEVLPFIHQKLKTCHLKLQVLNTNGEVSPFMDNDRQLIESNKLSTAQNFVAFRDDFIVSPFSSGTFDLAGHVFL